MTRPANVGHSRGFRPIRQSKISGMWRAVFFVSGPGSNLAMPRPLGAWPPFWYFVPLLVGRQMQTCLIVTTSNRFCEHLERHHRTSCLKTTMKAFSALSIPQPTAEHGHTALYVGNVGRSRPSPHATYYHISCPWSLKKGPRRTLNHEPP